jgi:O-antigen ligase
MIHLSYLSALLSELVWDPFDSVPVLVYGIVGLAAFLGRRGWRVGAVEWLYLLFCLHLLFSALFQENSERVLLYVGFYTLQFGVLSYWIREIRLRPDTFDVGMMQIVRWQSVAAVIGVVELILYFSNIESPLRNHLRSWKVDSIFKSPNIFGVMSAFVMIHLFDRKISFFRKQLLLSINLAAVLMSGSVMALGLVVLNRILRRFGFRISAIVGCAALLVAMDWVIANGPEMLNRRLEIWEAALNMWRTSPLIGVGTGNVQLEAAVIIDDRVTSGEYGTHSLILWLIAETGVTGLAIFGLFVAALFRNFLSTRWAKALYGLPIMLFVAQITENYLDHEEIFVMLFWLIVASTLVERNENRQSSK